LEADTDADAVLVVAADDDEDDDDDERGGCGVRLSARRRSNQ